MTQQSEQTGAIRTELARKIGQFVGPAVTRATEVPGLTLVRRTRLEQPGCHTYEPSARAIS